MSGSETGTMSGRDSFGIGLQKNQQIPQTSGIPSMRLAYSSDGTAVYKPVTVSSPPYQAGDGSTGQIGLHGINMNMGGGGGESMKRKRGRPRKYGPDGTMSLTLTPTGSSPPPVQPTVFSPPPPPTMSASAASPSSLKKARGRPLGSGKKQQMDALGSAGLGFTPHVITVKAGEDVSSKIMSFSQHGQRAICILSANGAISNVTLRQAATSGGTVTYEGRFEILSLCGSYLLSDSGGQRSRTGGLSVSLAGPDGRVLGGGVAGLLTAASPVQVVVGSFIPDMRKELRLLNQLEPSYVPCKHAQGGGTGTGSPPSTSSGNPGSPLNHSTGACNNNPPGIANIPWK